MFLTASMLYSRVHQLSNTFHRQRLSLTQVSGHQDLGVFCKMLGRRHTALSG